ncbi:carboxymuconolactone decarboxylase family protein [Aeromicrobium camelliae]|uniref:carboxymuconolactone decarboxylase family protein n=1 Tax=Aeromicrobium camelliae TaxID=1538144 RepID=UPI00363839DC
MPVRLRKLVPSELDEDQREVYEAIAGGDRSRGPQLFPLAQADGSLNGPYGVMLHAPRVGGPLQELGAALRFRTSLSDRIREIVILLVADRLGSEFQWWAHERIALATGLARQEIDAIRTDEFVGADEAESTAYALATDLLRGETLGDEDYARAVAVLGEQQLVELSVLVGYYRMLAQTMALFDVGVPED